MGNFFKGYEERTLIVKKFTRVGYPDSGDGAEALVDEFNKLVMYGDDYHDKIDERIDSFIDGVKYCGYEVEVERSEREDTDMYNDFDDKGMMKNE